MFSVKFIFFYKTMNSRKIVKIRDFHYFLFEPTKIRSMDVKRLYRQWRRFVPIFLISRWLKIGGAMTVSLVAMATATLFQF